MAIEQAPARTGRRPGQSGTKEAILAAARKRFAEVGFSKTSIRHIATEAGVDSALVHHYFGSKQDLFTAVVDLPIDPTAVLAVLSTIPDEELGAALVRAIVGVWDSPAGPAAVAMFRSVMAGDDSSLIRTFLLDVVFRDIRRRIDQPKGSGSVRIALVASQMAGLLVTRKILQIEPIASMPVDELAALIGPNLQRYLTGDVSGINKVG